MRIMPLYSVLMENKETGEKCTRIMGMKSKSTSKRLNVKIKNQEYKVISAKRVRPKGCK